MRSASEPVLPFCVIIYFPYDSQQAVEDRSQHMNRASALSRLRTLIALKGKSAVLQVMLLFQTTGVYY